MYIFISWFCIYGGCTFQRIILGPNGILRTPGIDKQNLCNDIHNGPVIKGMTVTVEPY